MAAENVVEARNIVKTYVLGKKRFEVLKGVSFSARKGEFLSIQGPSGSGKTTLIFLAAGLDLPDSGEIIVNGANLAEMSDKERTVWRRRNVGIVFQFYHLLPTLTALENILLVMELAGIPKKERTSRAMDLLDFVGLRNAADKYPAELSGGEQQRIAIARALAADPPVLLADEPTANLDTHNKVRIVKLLRKAAENGTTVIMATHDPALAEESDRILRLVDGAIVEE
ncbi:MAG: ABC transporter ATP-binding protein [Desulfurococcales archaeon]|nr:ABC transporter ATP-binding protein [Desulfurococcales archaeon]